MSPTDARKAYNWIVVRYPSGSDHNDSAQLRAYQLINLINKMGYVSKLQEEALLALAGPNYDNGKWVATQTTRTFSGH